MDTTVKAEAVKDAEGVTTRIVVADRGWVFVGRSRREGDNLVVEGARTIRRWGTKRGLMELKDGPTRATVLDEAGTVVVPMRAVIFEVICSRNW